LKKRVNSTPKGPGALAGGVLILDFGSQYTQLIARRIREANVYCEIHPYSLPASSVERMGVGGIVLSGGPSSIYQSGAPRCDKAVLELGPPVLGICYGMQLMAHLYGGEVVRGEEHEYGRAEIVLEREDGLFYGLAGHGRLEVWMSHADRIRRLPRGFRRLAWSKGAPIAAFAHPQRRLYGVQFHPEVHHTPQGKEILRNFLFRICGLAPSWNMHSFIEQAIADIRARVGDAKVICALSGGVDSSVVAILLHKAIGERLVCIFVDNGLLREHEAESVRELFQQHFGMNLVYVDATDVFLKKLGSVVDPEMKRRIIGREFIRIFEREARRIEGARFLAQGTLYPDVIESTSVRGPSSVIKTHHNVGALPKKMRLRLIEPLRELFKDEVRLVGRALGLPEDIIGRQPFPGPGLAVRIVGEVTEERLAILRKADRIVLEEITRAGLYESLWQSFAVLLPVKTVGVMGDGRTYEHVIAVRAVQSQDGMTADWSRLPYDLLAAISNRIINEVGGVNRVVYDISTKPPSTIEWE